MIGGDVGYVGKGIVGAIGWNREQQNFPCVGVADFTRLWVIRLLWKQPSLALIRKLIWGNQKLRRVKERGEVGKRSKRESRKKPQKREEKWEKTTNSLSNFNSSKATNQ